jgi:hypothetical protein
MKKRILAISVLVLSGGILCHAISFSLIGKTGYGTPAPGAGNLGAEDVNIGTGWICTWCKNTAWSTAEGFRALVGSEIEIFNGFTIEMLGGYVSSPEQSLFRYVSVPTSEADRAWVTPSFVPASITLKAKLSRGRFSFFGGAGPSVGFFAKSRMAEEYDDGVTVYRWEWTRDYHPAYGYHGVLGMEFRLTQRLSVVLDAKGELLTFAAQKDTLRAYSEDGVDLLLAAYPNVEDREIEYVSDLADYLNNYPGPDHPMQALRIWDSGSTLSVTVGFSWSF